VLVNELLTDYISNASLIPRKIRTTGDDGEQAGVGAVLTTVVDPDDSNNLIARWV